MAAAGDPQIAALIEIAGDSVPRLLGRVEEQLAQVASRQGPVLGPHAAATISAGGKRLRPLLVLLAAGSGAAGDERSAALVRAAASVELVHVATLVHDDVLDDAALRRGRPTIFASAGRDAAIQTGDALFASAFLLLLENGSPEQVSVLAGAGGALASGELLQRADAFDSSITIERYLLRCTLKTARLFEAACSLGSLVRGEAGDALTTFATEMGIAFQMLDDVLDIEGPPERTGKHRGTDLLDGTVTLPLLLAIERDHSLGELDFSTLNGAHEAEEVCARVIATGATGQAREVALAHVARAKEALPDDDRRPALAAVADSVVARYA